MTYPPFHRRSLLAGDPAFGKVVIACKQAPTGRSLNSRIPQVAPAPTSGYNPGNTTIFTGIPGDPDSPSDNLSRPAARLLAMVTLVSVR